jgi:hypothetical protein
MGRCQLRFVLATLCLGAGVLASCGDEDSRKQPADQATSSSEAQAKALAPYIVDPEQIAKTKPDTPERALTEFWQAIQFQNAEKAYDLLTTEVRDDHKPTAFERQVEDASPSFNSTPQVITRETDGTTAQLGVNLLFYGEDGDVIAITPLTFDLDEEAGAWRLADLDYFEERVAAARETGDATR